VIPPRFPHFTASPSESLLPHFVSSHNFAACIVLRRSPSVARFSLSECLAQHRFLPHPRHHPPPTHRLPTNFHTPPSKTRPTPFIISQTVRLIQGQNLSKSALFPAPVLSRFPSHHCRCSSLLIHREEWLHSTVAIKRYDTDTTRTTPPGLRNFSRSRPSDSTLATLLVTQLSL
jgi:hypothetical protein